MISDAWVNAIRNDFPALNSRRNGNPPIYFDSACTTLVSRQVIDALNEYYTGFPGCGYRPTGSPPRL